MRVFRASELAEKMSKAKQSELEVNQTRLVLYQDFRADKKLERLKLEVRQSSSGQLRELSKMYERHDIWKNSLRQPEQRMDIERAG